jgi:DtxR family transcriptional regulator, Mn-dependent transcriptional regulator
MTKEKRKTEPVTRLSESVEEYLEAIYKLECDGERVSVSAIAALVDRSQPSVSQMLARLRTQGLVERDGNSRVVLTVEGTRQGARLVRRHRLSERLLFDFLRLPWDRVHEEACRLEHAWSDESEERLVEQLDHPETCPHGHTIPYDDACPREVKARSLAELEAGESGVISRVSEEQADLLHYLASLGLLPETKVKIESIAPFGGPLLVQVGRARYALGPEVARKILMRS